MLSKIAPQKVKDKTVLVVGCGGLGGYVVEHLVRIGVGKVVIADCDYFSMSNLNRQLFSNIQNIGQNKAEEARQRALSINENVVVEPIKERVEKTNIQRIAKGCQLVFDCSDNVETKLLLEDFCEKQNIILIHGAISDVCGQVATIFPGDRTISKMYKDFDNENLPTLSYVPAIVASIQVSEGIKALIGEKHTLRSKVLIFDLYTNQIRIL